PFVWPREIPMQAIATSVASSAADNLRTAELGSVGIMATLPDRGAGMVLSRPSRASTRNHRPRHDDALPSARQIPDRPEAAALRQPRAHAARGSGHTSRSHGRDLPGPADHL